MFFSTLSDATQSYCHNLTDFADDREESPHCDDTYGIFNSFILSPRHSINTKIQTSFILKKTTLVEKQNQTKH